MCFRVKSDPLESLLGFVVVGMAAPTVGMILQLHLQNRLFHLSGFSDRRDSKELPPVPPVCGFRGFFEDLVAIAVLRLRSFFLLFAGVSGFFLLFFAVGAGFSFIIFLFARRGLSAGATLLLFLARAGRRLCAACFACFAFRFLLRTVLPFVFPLLSGRRFFVCGACRCGGGLSFRARLLSRPSLVFGLRARLPFFACAGIRRAFFFRLSGLSFLCCRACFSLFWSFAIVGCRRGLCPCFFRRTLLCLSTARALLLFPF
jgi:hypothetical protein